jgi:hypothetical protein
VSTAPIFAAERRLFASDFFDHSLAHDDRALHQLRKDATVPRVARLRAVQR